MIYRCKYCSRDYKVVPRSASVKPGVCLICATKRKQDEDFFGTIRVNMPTLRLRDRTERTIKR